ncbi:hypothetical protein Tco_1006891 [Tanacetum coccineum]|uniref:Uncharacterized protein n=1 Tax=Tanacetum coccineum TaxID=301880 RepID=A0ABQ5FJ60_9ASTR
MPKQSSPFNDSSKENSPIASSNQTSPPLIDPYMTRVFQAKSPPQSDNQSQPTQPLFPCNEPSQENHSMTPSNLVSPQTTTPLLIDPYVDDISQGNHNINQTLSQLPPSLTRERLVDEINQLQDLSNLLAMHLSNQTANPPPTPSNMPHTITLDQVEYHVGYYPCCRYTQKQFLSLSKDLNWIEYLLTRPYPPLQVSCNYPTTTTSAPNSPPTTH